MKKEVGNFNDILNIQGEDIPRIDDKLHALLEKGKARAVKILPGASTKIFGKKLPYAQTHVSITFDSEEDLRRCVRLLRWSDQRLLAIGSSIAWSWERSIRKGMEISFSVNWYDKEFYLKRSDAFKDSNHLSYFSMFGKSTSDMRIVTEVLEKG